jgi:hypothetical protein
MKRKAIFVIFLSMGLVIASCSSSGTDVSGTGGAAGSGGGTGGAAGSGGKGSGGVAGSGGGTGTTTACNGTSLVAAEANNYAFSSTLTFPPIAVAPNSEISFDWGGVTKDFIGHAVDPKKDLNQVSVLMWSLPLTDLQTQLNSDTIKQSSLTTVPLVVTTDGSSTSANLFSFKTSAGTEITSTDVLPYFNATDYAPDTHTYLFTGATGTTVGSGIRMMQSFQLDPNSTNTKVTMTSDSTKLTYTANLHSLTATTIPTGQSAITLDWSSLKNNALGNTFKPTSITAAMIAHYTETPTELEAKFLDIQLISTAMYKATIETGTSVDFSSLKDADGNAFPGIDTSSGTWIVAIQCGSCRNPAPLYMSILKPCS